MNKSDFGFPILKIFSVSFCNVRMEEYTMDGHCIGHSLFLREDASVLV